MYRDKKHFEDLAIEFKNELILNRCQATVHLESEEDEMFWDAMLQYCRPGSYNYKYHSKSVEGKDTQGCTQCLNFKDYLCPQLFICIDSDCRFLRKEQYLDAAHYIIQTYCYSWENHYCFAEKLQIDLIEKCPDAAKQFDFRIFLKNYSSTIYEYFLLFLYLGRIGKLSICPKKKFNELVSTQYRKGDEIGNGISIVNRIKSELSSYFSTIDAIQFNETSEREHYGKLGLTSSNVYLYLRGHNLQNLIISIGNHICNSSEFNFKKDILYKSLSQKAYPEISNIKADLQSF